MKRAGAIWLMTAGLIAAPVGAALSATAAANGTLTFSGSCSFSGVVRFKPPLTNTPQPITDVATASGTCTGTLTDRAGRTHTLNAAPVGYFATDQGNGVSCALSPDATGVGELTFRQGPLLFTISETRAAVVGTLSMKGDGGGAAAGVANVSTSANAAQIIERCAGAGLTSTPLDINIRTAPTMSS